jgi:hypothetical protein
VKREKRRKKSREKKRKNSREKRREEREAEALSTVPHADHSCHAPPPQQQQHQLKEKIIL